MLGAGLPRWGSRWIGRPLRATGRRPRAGLARVRCEASRRMRLGSGRLPGERRARMSARSSGRARRAWRRRDLALGGRLSTLGALVALVALLVGLRALG